MLDTVGLERKRESKFASMGLAAFERVESPLDKMLKPSGGMGWRRPGVWF